MTEHKTNLTSEIAVLYTKISININKLVQGFFIHKLYELRLKKDKVRNSFQMSRHWFYVAQYKLKKLSKKKQEKSLMY